MYTKKKKVAFRKTSGWSLVNLVGFCSHLLVWRPVNIIMDFFKMQSRDQMRPCCEDRGGVGLVKNMNLFNYVITISNVTLFLVCHRLMHTDNIFMFVAVSISRPECVFVEVDVVGCYLKASP